MELKKMFRIDEPAYLEFIKITAGKRNYYTVAFTAAIIIVLSLVFQFSETSRLASLGMGAIYAAVYAVIVLVFSRFTTANAAKRSYNNRKMRRIKLILTFDENGLTQQQKGDKDSHSVEWAKFAKVTETPLSFLFYLNNSQAVVACKKGLLDTEIARIRQIISEIAPVKNPKIKLKLFELQNDLAAKLPEKYEDLTTYTLPEDAQDEIDAAAEAKAREEAAKAAKPAEKPALEDKKAPETEAKPEDKEGKKGEEK